MTAAELRSLLLTAQAGSLGAAAAALGVPAAEVGRRIRAADASIGAPLFTTGDGGMLTLTPVGAALAAYGERALGLARDDDAGRGRAPSRAHGLLEARAEDGVAVAVHDLGGDGRPVLLAHPMGFTGAVMGALARNLRDAHCYAPDLRGHGHTAVPEGYGFPPLGNALDVIATADLIAGEHGRPPIGVGHSLGAAALVLAESRRPGTFSRLYLYEPAIIPPDGRTRIDADSPYIRRTLRRRRHFPSLHAAAANYAGKPPMQDFVADAFLGYIEHGFAVSGDGGATMRCLPEIEAAISMSGVSYRAFEQLGEIGCPVVVARSTLAESPGRAPFELEVLAALPDARLEFVGPLTHFGPQQQPARVASFVQRFVDDVAP